VTGARFLRHYSKGSERGAPIDATALKSIADDIHVLRLNFLASTTLYF